MYTFANDELDTYEAFDDEREAERNRREQEKEKLQKRRKKNPSMKVFKA